MCPLSNQQLQILTTPSFHSKPLLDLLFSHLSAVPVQAWLAVAAVRPSAERTAEDRDSALEPNKVRFREISD